jgi:hypothetical protein
VFVTNLRHRDYKYLKCGMILAGGGRCAAWLFELAAASAIIPKSKPWSPSGRGFFVSGPAAMTCGLDKSGTGHSAVVQVVSVKSRQTK